MSKRIDVQETAKGFLVRCNHIEAPGACLACMSLALSELLEWRSGKRRVFWRVRWTQGTGDKAHTLIYSYCKLNKARWERRHLQDLGGEAKLFRVTVRPKTKGDR